MNRQQDPQEARASVYLYIGDAVIDARHKTTFIPDGLTPQQLVAVEFFRAAAMDAIPGLIVTPTVQQKKT